MERKEYEGRVESRQFEIKKSDPLVFIQAVTKLEQAIDGFSTLSDSISEMKDQYYELICRYDLDAVVEVISTAGSMDNSVEAAEAVGLLPSVFERDPEIAYDLWVNLLNDPETHQQAQLALMDLITFATTENPLRLSLMTKLSEIAGLSTS